jgi:hypothetical protein
LVVPHEELGVLLEDVLGDLARHGDDGGVVALLPCLPEAGADGLEAEHLQTPLPGLAVLLELAQQGALAELAQLAGPVSIHNIPAVSGAREEDRGPKAASAVLSVGDLAEPLRQTPASEALARRVARHAGEVLGEPVPIEGVPLYTDARHYAAAGIPVILYGAGPRTLEEANAHRADERLPLALLPAAARVVARTARELLSGA